MGRGGNNGGDTKFLYVAGLYWLEGLNAYAPEVTNQLGTNLVGFERYDFAYPPQISPLCLLLASFSFAKAVVLMNALNLFCALVLAFFSVRSVKRPEVKTLKDPGPEPWWFIPALIIGNPFTTKVVNMGQTTLIAAAALVGGWYYARRDRWLVGGILIAIATIKPQLSLLVILWLLLERQWRLLGVTTVTIVIFSLAPMAISGPIDVFFDWFAVVKEYKEVSFNVVGSRHVFNLQGLFYIAGVDLPNLLPLAIILTCLLWWYRLKLLNDDILGILVAITLLFGFAHYYDLAAVLPPLIAAFWRHVRNSEGKTLVAICLMLAIFFMRPGLFDLFDTGNQYLVSASVLSPLLLVSVIWLLVMSFKRAEEIKLITSATG